MRNSSNQVEVLIWRSQAGDLTSVDEYGHVELFVRNKCYSFLPDHSLNPSDFAVGRGCEGLLLPRPFIAVAIWYLDRVMQQREDEVLFDPQKHKELPIVWSFTFEASKKKIDTLVAFLESKAQKPPLYAAIPSKKRDTFNCQTFSLESLRVADIFGEPVGKSTPDALFDFLKKSVGRCSGLKGAEELQLVPPQFSSKVIKERR